MPVSHEKIYELVSSLRSDVAVINAKLDNMANLPSRVQTLEADFHTRKGERGVWSAIVNSKSFAWLAATFTALAAWISSGAHNGIKP